MAVTRVVEVGQGRRRSSYQTDWRLVAPGTFSQERQHVRSFRISTDDPLDRPGETMLLEAWVLGLPEQWAAMPDDPECKLTSYEFEEVPTHPGRWLCNAVYTLLIDPLLEPTVVKFSTKILEVTIEEDRFGAAILNAASDAIEGITTPEIVGQFTVEKNRPVSGAGSLSVVDYIENFHNRVNAESEFEIWPHGTFPHGTLLLADFGVDYQNRNAMDFIRWTHVIEARWRKTVTVDGVTGPLGHRLRVLNAGWRHYAAPEIADFRLLTYRSVDGQPVQSPGLLDEAGGKLPNGGTPNFLTFEVKDEAEFGSLGLF